MQLAAHTIGGWAMRLLCLSVPVAAIAVLCGVDMTIVSPWFFVSLPLAVVQGFAVDYLFACLLIRMRNLEWCVRCLRTALTSLLTGSLIPFAALPWGIGNWLQLSPFGTLTGAPLAIYTGLGDPASLIPAQIIWNIVLWPLAMVCFNASSMNDFDVPGFETVRRARQKVQVKFPELSACEKVAEFRGENEQKYRAYALGDFA